MRVVVGRVVGEMVVVARWEVEHLVAVVVIGVGLGEAQEVAMMVVAVKAVGRVAVLLGVGKAAVATPVGQTVAVVWVARVVQMGVGAEGVVRAVMPAAADKAAVGGGLMAAAKLAVVGSWAVTVVATVVLGAELEVQAESTGEVEVVAVQADAVARAAREAIQELVEVARASTLAWPR